MKMYSKILMVVLLAYFLDNLSAAILKPTTPTSLNEKNNPAQSKNILLQNPPINKHFSVLGNFKVNPVVPLNINASPLAPPSQPLLPTSTPTSPVKLPASLASTRVPPALPSPTLLQNLKKENVNHQKSNAVEEVDDDDEEEVEEEIEDEDYEEPLENSKTVTSTPIPSSSTSKLSVPEIVKQENNNRQGSDISEEGDDYEEEEVEEEIEDEDYEEPLENSKIVTSTPIPSSSTSKLSVPEIVKQENNNRQGSDISEEGDDYEEEEVEEEIEDEDYEEPLENSKIVTSTPIPSSSTSKFSVPEIVKQENNNRQGSDISEEGDDYEEEEVEEEIEDEDYEEPLENSKIVTSTPIPSSSTSKFSVPETVKQEKDNRQGSDTGEEGDDYEGDDYEEYYDDTVEEDGHNDEVNPPVTITTRPQLSDDELIENNYNDSKYSMNTNEDNQTYDDTQISTNKKEDNIEDQLNNQYLSENKERIVNRYTALKKILYMLHDYASLTFNWIINKINYRMEQFSVR